MSQCVGGQRSQCVFTATHTIKDWGWGFSFCHRHAMQAAKAINLQSVDVIPLTRENRDEPTFPSTHQ